MQEISPNAEDSMEGWVGPQRRRLPTTRRSITHGFNIAGHSGYVTAGMYEDGTLGEIFISDFGKSGSTLNGLLQAFAAMTSIAIQHGASLDMLARKFCHMKFEPYGFVDHPEIQRANSVIDYIFRWLALRFGSEELNDDLNKIRQKLAQ